MQSHLLWIIRQKFDTEPLSKLGDPILLLSYFLLKFGIQHYSTFFYFLLFPSVQ